MELGEYPTLEQLTIKDGVVLAKCPFVDIGPFARLYYEPNEKGGGFTFKAVVFVSTSGECADMFADPTTGFEVLFHGIAYHDGLRHLYMGAKETDNENYLYYPDAELLRDLFTALRNLEKEHCS